jgi:H+-transporting ATPase
MLVKKTEIVLFLAAGLLISGHAIMTPVLMVLMLVTNDFLAMSLTTDIATPGPSPSVWRMRNITASAFILGVCKLGFSVTMLLVGKLYFKFGTEKLQTLAFVTLVFGAQAVIYVVRERRHLWSSMPSKWVLAASIVDIAIVSGLAASGTLMEPLPWNVIALVLLGSLFFAFILDQIKAPVTAALKVR